VQAACLALNLARPNAGNSILAKIAMIAMTTSNSMSVKREEGEARLLGAGESFMLTTILGRPTHASIELHDHDTALPQPRLTDKRRGARGLTTSFDAPDALAEGQELLPSSGHLRRTKQAKTLCLQASSICFVFTNADPN